MSDIEALARHVLDQPVDLLGVVDEFSTRVMRKSEERRERLWSVMAHEVEAGPCPLSGFVRDQCCRGLAELQDFGFAMRMETRADLVARLAEAVGPVIRVDQFSRLPGLAAE